MSIQIIIKDGHRIYPCRVYKEESKELLTVDEINNEILNGRTLKIKGMKYSKYGDSEGITSEIIAAKDILTTINIKESTVLNSVYTLKEAAEKWALADGSSIRKAIERNKFYNTEIKQSGSVWIVTENGMNRVFGQRDIKDKYIINIKQLLIMKTRINILEIKDEFGEISNEEREELFFVIKALQKLLDEAISCLEKGKLVFIRSNSKEKPVEIIKTKEEFFSFIKAIEKKSILLNTKININ